MNGYGWLMVVKVGEMWSIYKLPKSNLICVKIPIIGIHCVVIFTLQQVPQNQNKVLNFITMVKGRAVLSSLFERGSLWVKVYFLNKP